MDADHVDPRLFIPEEDAWDAEELTAEELSVLFPDPGDDVLGARPASAEEREMASRALRAMELEDSGRGGWDLVQAAWEAASEGDDLSLLSDAEIIGRAIKCREVTARAQGRMFRSVEELLRRRKPRRQHRRGERAQEARDAYEGIDADAEADAPMPRMPVMPSAEAASELALAFTLTEYAAEKLTAQAADLSRRLPTAFAELEAGRLAPESVRILCDGTQDLSDEDAGKVDALLSGQAASMTTGELRDAVRRAVIRIDPEAADKRRKRSERQSRVRLYANANHTATLSVEDAPAAQAAAAIARVFALARAAKSAGAKEGLDLLASKMALGLLLGTLPMVPPPLPPDDGAGPGGGGPANGGPDDRGPDDRGPGNDLDDGGLSDGWPDDSVPEDSVPEDGGPRDGVPDDPGPDDGPALDEAGPAPGDWSGTGDPAPEPGESGESGESVPWPGIPDVADAAAPGCAVPPAGLLRAKDQGRARLMVPWRTAAGMASLPGELSWYGAVTRGQARELAAAAAADPAVRWTVIVTDEAGAALAVTRLRDRRGRKSPGLVDEVTVTISASLAAGLDSDDATKHWTRMLLRTTRDTGNAKLADVLGKTVVAANKAAAEAGVRAVLDEVVGGCAHTTEAAGYKVPDTMRRWLAARDRTCRNPICRRRAAQCDQDHTRAYDKGGRTCPCNLGSLCRRHHQLKQLPGWHVEQDGAGRFTWITPAGLAYREEPHVYAV